MASRSVSGTSAFRLTVPSLSPPHSPLGDLMNPCSANDPPTSPQRGPGVKLRAAANRVCCLIQRQQLRPIPQRRRPPPRWDRGRQRSVVKAPSPPSGLFPQAEQDRAPLWTFHGEKPWKTSPSMGELWGGPQTSAFLINAPKPAGLKGQGAP